MAVKTHKQKEYTMHNKRMKIQEADYERLARMVNATLEKNPQAKAGYIAKGLSFARFAWDTFHVASDTAMRERVEDYLWIRGLSDKLDDVHIETALKDIIGTYNVKIKAEKITIFYDGGGDPATINFDRSNNRARGYMWTKARAARVQAVAKVV